MRIDRKLFDWKRVISYGWNYSFCLACAMIGSTLFDIKGGILGLGSSILICCLIHYLNHGFHKNED